MLEVGQVNEHLLEAFVPLRALTPDHLNTLLRDTAIETVCADQVLFDIGDHDRQAVYLISGTLDLESVTGDVTTLEHSDPVCRYPVADRQPRRHKATARTDCSLVRFDRDALDAMLCWGQAANYLRLAITARSELDADARWMLSLLDSNLFHKVPPMNLMAVLHCFSPLSVQAGDVVVRQGELGDACYYLESGQAEVTRTDEEGGEPVSLALLKAGDSFGEDALLNETTRNATVTMQTDGNLQVLKKSDFRQLLKPQEIGYLGLADARKAVRDDGAVWVDVRTQDEFEAGHHAGALHAPLDILWLKARLLSKEQPYILYCDTGRRSAVAQYLLSEEGYRVSALKNGFGNYPDDDRDAFLAETGDTAPLPVAAA